LHCLVFVFAFLFIWGIVKLNLRRLEKDKKRLEGVVQERTKEINENYENVKTLSQIGKNITSSLNIEEISAMVYDELQLLIPVESFGIGLYNKEEQTIDYKSIIEGGKSFAPYSRAMQNKNQFPVWCIDNRKSILVNDVAKEYSKYFDEFEYIEVSGGIKQKALICIPMIVKGQITGLISIQHTHTNIYSNYHLNIAQNIAVYAAIALDNAGAFKKIEEQKEEILTQNEEMQQQQQEIEAQRDYIQGQNDELKIKNSHITDSINAAKIIQSAILPFNEKIEELFSDFFVLFKPKDIVSGDFYWQSRDLNGDIYVATIDCTGHGVPGAFMSMIAYATLNDIINKDYISSPADVLEELHKNIRYSLQEKESESKAGMDVCICRISLDNKVVFAGAKRPLIYQKNGELNIIKGTRRSIGTITGLSSNLSFENHEILLSKGDRLYLTSDGYMDSANYRRKRLGSSLFFNLIKENTYLNLPEQKELLEQALDQHQGTEQQRDDITILALQL